MRRVLFLSLVVLVAVAPVGCSDGDISTTTSQTTSVESTARSTVNTAGSESTSTTTSEADSLELPMLAPTVIDVPHEEVANAVISTQGGVLEYGPVKVDVPAGALAVDTTISLTRLDAPFHSEPTETVNPGAVTALPISSVYDFGPAGVRFEKPVTVTLPYDSGMGPDGIDPEKVALAYWNGQEWMAVRGTVDPQARTVSVELKEFQGTALNVILLITGAGLLIDAGVKFYYGGEGVDDDRLSEGKASQWVTPDNTEVQKQAQKAMILNQTTRETKSLDDPDLAEWLKDAVSRKQMPTLVYGNPNPVRPSDTYIQISPDTGEGSNWQKPADYFTKGTKTRPGQTLPTVGGPFHGDCTDTTNSAVSIFRAKGFKAKGVFGYGGGDKRRPHVWGEVLIGDRVYRIDFTGDLITPESDEGHYGQYQAVTDPDDPRYQSMWDDEGQEPYDPMWFEEGEFADLVGTFEGIISGLLSGGGQKADVPWEFEVDERGDVTGGWDYEWTAHGVQTVLTLTGQVSDTGELTASGTQTLTSMSSGKTQSGQISLEGQISGATFTGTMKGEAGAVQVSAHRQ